MYEEKQGDSLRTSTSAAEGVGNMLHNSFTWIMSWKLFALQHLCESLPGESVYEFTCS